MTSAPQMIADGIGCQNGLSADLRIRKRVVRLLIEEIVATVNQNRSLELVIQWKGGKHTTLKNLKNRTGQH